jgi:hypothetical protein
MRMASVAKRYRWLLLVLAAGMAGGIPLPAAAGPYRDSAHGNSSYGVDRSAIDGNYAQYATGNCGHCHEAHASYQGAEPAPANGPAAHALFAAGFNSNRTRNAYLESDDFCFYCHNSDSGPQVINQDYSTTFGGGATGSGPQSIMAAFNQTSYHNLYDIWNFLSNDATYSTWFAKRGNPCSACHNSHMAKRNSDSAQPGFPLLSAISRPGVSGSLWGESEVMSAYFGYEAPFAYANTREPAGVGDQDGAKTPDFVGFCTSCHNPDKTLWSTTLNRELKKINWGNTGEGQNKHGALSREGTDHFREPYATAAPAKSNFVLSCLDCHEAHGSENVVLLRRRINGEDLEGILASTDAMSYACKRCHQDDLEAAAGTGVADRWEYVHHLAADAPYAKSNCIDCHASIDGSLPVACGNCHGHGMDDSWAVANPTGRKTF